MTGAGKYAATNMAVGLLLHDEWFYSLRHSFTLVWHSYEHLVIDNYTVDVPIIVPHLALEVRFHCLLNALDTSVIGTQTENQTIQ